MSSYPTLEVPASELTVGRYVGYLNIGTTRRLPAVVANIWQVEPDGMLRVTVRLVLTGEERHVWCTPAAPWPVEIPPTYADRAHLAPVFACEFKNRDDGCCNHPGIHDAECWVIGADAATDRLLGAEEGDGIHWAPCPLVPYPSEIRVGIDPAGDGAVVVMRDGEVLEP